MTLSYGIKILGRKLVIIPDLGILDDTSKLGPRFDPLAVQLTPLAPFDKGCDAVISTYHKHERRIGL